MTEKTSQKLRHLATAARGAKDIASEKSDSDMKREARGAAAAKALRAKVATEAGIDPQVIEEVDPGSVPNETIEQYVSSVHNDDKYNAPNLRMRKRELRELYITSTLSMHDFLNKFLREDEGRSTWEAIISREKWDTQRVEYFEARTDAVVERFKDSMEDMLEEHNQLHLQISMQIGKKIMQMVPNCAKPVEIQACAVALKNIQAVSRLALGASTDNTALKGVDDFEQFLKGVKQGG